MRAAVVVPVKGFGAAKVRLAGELSPAGRAALAQEMADGVLLAAGPLPTYVVCDDTEVAEWAAAAGATVAWTPGLGLDGAVAAGVARAAGEGARRVVVAHADLPMATGLDHVVGVFARLVEPIEFGAIDEMPVDLVFLLLSPPDAGVDHLKALASVSRQLRDRSFVAKLRGAGSEDALYALLVGGETRDAA